MSVKKTTRRSSSRCGSKQAFLCNSADYAEADEAFVFKNLREDAKRRR
jgi:hypothetical protein